MEVIGGTHKLLCMAKFIEVLFAEVTEWKEWRGAARGKSFNVFLVCRYI